MMIRTSTLVANAAMLASCAFLAAAPASAQSVGDFYQGKQLRLVVPVGAGGVFALYGLIVSEHMSKHLPGNPTIVPEYQPGAGGVKAMNYMYRAAAQDGSVIGMPHPSLVLAQHLSPTKVRFDAAKFNYIGRISDTTRLIVTWHTSKVRSLADAKQHVSILGTSGKSSNTYIQPAVINALLGTKFKLISGYQGTAKQFIAMESGEIDSSTTSWIHLWANHPDWLTSKKVNMIIQIGMEPVEGIKGVPLLLDLVKNKADRQVAAYMAHTSDVGYGFFAPPGIPSRFVEALRAAYQATLKDPAFLADAKKRKAPLGPATGEKVTSIIHEAVSTPKEVIERFQKLSKG